MKENTFIFVVCGGDEHIDTINLSLNYLRHFSKNKIVVVTELSRNSKEIIHDEIVNIETSASFNHHQASIFLKTSLHKILPQDRDYCYLDSDVIATNSKVDDIFSHKKGPITFASDHCSLPEFSPNAIRCGCREKSEKNVEELNKLDLEFKVKYIPSDPEIYKRYIHILQVMEDYDNQFNGAKRNPLIRFLLYHLQPSKYDFARYLKANGNFRWDNKLKKAFDVDNNLIYDEYNKYSTYVEARSSFKWDNNKGVWFDEDGTAVYKASCGHLKEEIAKKFSTEITNPSWIHWNGGVFLFNAESISFMDEWHEKTMQIFEDPDWETRDQGTLAATVWKYKLQDQQRLPAEFNLLADYNSSNLKFKEGGSFSYDDFITTITPNFLHVYHQFGNKEWNVWRYVESLMPSEKEPA